MTSLIKGLVTKKISDVIKKQREEFDNLLNSINPTNKAFQKLDEWQAKLASASKKVFTQVMRLQSITPYLSRLEIN